MEPIVIHSISELVTVRGNNTLRQGEEMNQVEIIKDGYILIDNGKFEEIGQGKGYIKYRDNVKMINAKGCTITPGLIDSHTHLVHASSREHEFEMKLNGISYLDILKGGGGILSTVNKTKQASFDELFNKAKNSLNKMMQYGTTSVEAKSGYGLELKTELNQLKVAKKLNEIHPVTLVNTFLGAHAIPLEYKNKTGEYIALVKEMLEVVRKEDLADFCDVFCEKGVFSIKESEEILQYAASLGYKLKIHADEIVPLGGASLAARLNCISADHLLASKVRDMKNLAAKKIVASILPLTSFYLNKPYAKARTMIKHNCGLSISTDYNPGSSPCENIQLAMQVASIKAKMTPKEVITAVTINAAVSLGLENTKGSIEVGKDADFVIFDALNLDYILYHFGINHVKDVYIKGEIVVRNQQVINL